MAYSDEELEGFFDAVESLKKYRRADLIDDTGRNLLKELYTDLLPNDHILKKSLRENTTFLIGRKGTGKSTIFLRIEQELRSKKGFLPCYLDVKTIYESSNTGLSSNTDLESLINPQFLKKYLVERAFIQAVLMTVLNEISKKFDSNLNVLLEVLGLSKVEETKEKLLELKHNIEDNQVLERIELPILQKINSVNSISNRQHTENHVGPTKLSMEGKVSTTDVGLKIKVASGDKQSVTTINQVEDENNFSSIFLQVFQIKEIIIGIKDILSVLGIRHLYILLDDFSEIEDDSIKTFVDVVLAPLNNWSEEFIKFKIAAYPNRIYYGKIDPGKIDTIELDFYNLYSEFDRDKMEVNAIDFTKRILEKRFKKFTDKMPEIFFDLSLNSIEDYYEILFNASMNVPRILGYLLSYCYQSRIIYHHKINKSDIEMAAQRYYEDKIYPFFETTTHSLVSLNEKITALQLKNLLEQFIEKSKDIKKRITTSELKGSIYIQKEPFSSHFHFDPRFEEFIKTLELNYFISKYNDLSDKDGNPVSIYSLNYGLSKKHNIIWGKPKGTAYRKYFIERPFNYNKLIKEFLSNSERIICTNPSCKKQFSIDDMKFLEFTKYKCNECSAPVIIEYLADDVIDAIEKIEKTKMLPVPEVKILKELQNSDTPLYARDLAQEIDYSGQFIGWRSKKLTEIHKLIIRTKESGKPYIYSLTEEGKHFFVGWKD